MLRFKICYVDAIVFSSFAYICGTEMKRYLMLFEIAQKFEYSESLVKYYETLF